MQSDKKKQDDHVFVKHKRPIPKIAKITKTSILITVRNDHVLFYGSSNILFFRSYDQCQFFFFKLVKCQVKQLSTNRKILSQGNMWNIKALALALTIQMLLRKLKFFQKIGHTPRSRSQVKKNLGFHWKVVIKKTKIVCTQEKVLPLGILMWNIRALAFTVQKLLARLKFQTDLRNARMAEWYTGEKKPRCPPIFDLGGINLISISMDSIQGHTISLNLINTTIYRL